MDRFQLQKFLLWGYYMAEKYYIMKTEILSVKPKKMKITIIIFYESLQAWVFETVLNCTFLIHREL